MRRLIALALLFAAPLAPAAGEPASESRMVPLADLVGTWRGTGWMLMPDGTRTEFESQEIVTTRLSGAALLVEGRHWRPGNPNDVVHDAMAMITWDAAAGAYRFRTALASGRGGDYPLEVGDRRFTWRMVSPQGTTEFATVFGGGTWRERGRRILPDGRSVDFFEMTLTRE
jgi:hypothetical protein